MAIPINQINTSPLEGAARQGTNNLGLKAYGLDLGAVQQGLAAGIFKAADLQELYARQQNAVKIQELANSGALSRQKAADLSADNRTQMQLKSEEMRSKWTNAIQQQQVDQQGDYYKGQNQLGQAQLGLDQQRLGVDVQFKNADLGLKQQELQQIGAFQQGQLGIQGKQVDLQKQELEQQKQFKMMDYAATLDKEQRQVIGSAGAMMGMVQQLYPNDPKRANEAINRGIDFLKTQGLSDKDADKYKAMPLDQKYSIGQGALMVAHTSQQIGAKAKEAGMQVSIGADGNPKFTPVQPQNKLDDNLAKQDAIAAKEAADNRDALGTFKQSIDVAKKDLAATPEALLGPFAGMISKYRSPAVQNLESSLNSLALQAKTLYKLGSGQGFTDADRDFLVQIQGGVKTYKDTTEELLKKSEDLINHANAASWIRENNIRKNSTTYNSWLNDNPAPDVTVKNKDGQVGHIRADELKDALKEGYIQI